ncbi:MAG TPA: adenylate/guanylate cyclase domain-containing protein, partial [Candidatus Wallbacteria bacterium]|nr:adenylate/guanylate cyclase domain-containing protein [Candidatus Wallbacteria bacterium]
NLFPPVADYAKMYRTASDLSDITIANVLLTIILLWLYIRVRPICKFIGTGDEQLRAAGLQKFNEIYKTIIIFFTMSALCNIWRFFYTNEGNPAFSVSYLPYFFAGELFRFYYSTYFTVLYLEPLLFLKIAAGFYDEKTLYEKKKGLALTIKAKLYLMIFNLLIIPMAVIAGYAYLIPVPYLGAANLKAAADNPKEFYYVLRECKVYITIVIIVSLTYAVGYLEMLYKSINRPLDTVLKKMELLASGDLGVRTTVLSDDEIGTLKHNFNVMVESLAERERLRETFGKFVSIEIAKHLMASNKIDLGGEDIEATILFSDIRNFTAMSEKMSAREVVDFLNEYFSFITEPIMQNRGVINKFIGDAVMALYIPHLGSADHVSDAVKSAVGMREKLRQFNEMKKRPVDVNFGIGIHTGVLVAGNIGTSARLEYTVIGDTVNVASRIESENKTFKSDILISEETYLKLDGELKKAHSFEKCEPVSVKGKQKPLILYKIV